MTTLGSSLFLDFPGDRWFLVSASNHSLAAEVGVCPLDEDFGDLSSLLDPVICELLVGDLSLIPGETKEKKKPRGIVSGVPGDIGGVLTRTAS